MSRAGLSGCAADWAGSRPSTSPLAPCTARGVGTPSDGDGEGGAEIAVWVVADGAAAGSDLLGATTCKAVSTRTVTLTPPSVARTSLRRPPFDALASASADVLCPATTEEDAKTFATARLSRRKPPDEGGGSLSDTRSILEFSCARCPPKGGPKSGTRGGSGRRSKGGWRSVDDSADADISALWLRAAISEIHASFSSKSCGTAGPRLRPRPARLLECIARTVDHRRQTKPKKHPPTKAAHPDS
jgi:hypothetical protein